MTAHIEACVITGAETATHKFLKFTKKIEYGGKEWAYSRS